MPRKKVNVGQSDAPRRRRWWLWGLGVFVGLVVLGALLPPVDETPTPNPSPESGGGEQTPVPTVTPEATLSDEARVLGIVAGEVSGEVESVTVNLAVPSVVVRYMSPSGDVGYISRQMVRVICALRDEYDYLMMLDAMIETVDALGNPGVQSGVTVAIEAETVREINCENAGAVELSMIAERFTVDPLLER